MKKLFAIVLALLLVLAPAALAENAGVFTLSSPVLNLNMGGENMSVDLSGLDLVISAGLAGETPSLQIDINGNGEKLFGAAANVQGDRFVVAVEGMSTPVYVQIPETLNNLSSLDLSGLDIDIESLAGIVMGQLEINSEGDTTTFKLPYTAVNEVLAAIAPALSSIEIEGVDTAELAEELAELKDSDNGINIEGSYSATETGIAVNASIIPVDDGTAADAAANLSVVLGDTIDVTLEVPGAGSFALTLAPQEDDSINLSLRINAEGVDAELTATVSVSEADATFTEIDAANAVNLEELADEDAEALIGELYGAAGNLIGFVFGALGAAA